MVIKVWGDAYIILEVIRVSNKCSCYGLRFYFISFRGCPCVARGYMDYKLGLWITLIDCCND